MPVSPRVDGGPGSGVMRVSVPWARPHSGFSLLMESMMLLLVRSGITVTEAARVVGEYPQRLWGNHPPPRCSWVMRSRIPEMRKVARSIRAHWDGVVAYLRTRVTNGAAEALNGTIQTAKRKVRGFRTVEYFAAIIHRVASRLQVDLPNPVPPNHTKSS
jgi:hypothetical protein